VPRVSCGGAADCRREVAEGRRFASGWWSGGGVRRCSRRRQGGGVRRPSAVRGREGGVRRREGRGRRVGVGDWGIGRNGRMRLVLASECWAEPKMNVGLKYFVA
jgi:hypothetical protein